MAKLRRTFTREFKLAAVKMVTEQGYSYAATARKLDLRDHLIRRWKAEFATDGQQAFRGQGVPLIEDELTRLRAENKRPTMERDILTKATAFFAKESL